MGFDIQIPLEQRRANRKPPSKKQHVDEGFPHYSSRFPGFCMCDDTCCNGEAGCKCKTCPCKTGYEHGVHYDEEIQHEASASES